jgi:hypothetical protein
MGEGGGGPLLCVSAALQDALHAKGIIIRNSHNSPMALFASLAELDRTNAVSVTHR